MPNNGSEIGGLSEPSGTTPLKGSVTVVCLVGLCKQCHVMGPEHFLDRAVTLKLPFEAPSRSFFDRLDIFSTTIDLKNTLAQILLGLGHPNINLHSNQKET